LRDAGLTLYGEHEAVAALIRAGNASGAEAAMRLHAEVSLTMEQACPREEG
jgi:DNA-binding FadR family transcriptional regulator